MRRQQLYVGLWIEIFLFHTTETTAEKAKKSFFLIIVVQRNAAIVCFSITTFESSFCDTSDLDWGQLGRAAQSRQWRRLPSTCRQSDQLRRATSGLFLYSDSPLLTNWNRHLSIPHWVLGLCIHFKLIKKSEVMNCSHFVGVWPWNISLELNHCDTSHARSGQCRSF